MNLIRSDKEVALNDLIVATRETVDHYRDAVEFLEDENLKRVFSTIANQREGFIERLENAVRALGDLPSVPDPDKEAGTMLLHHAGALLTGDYNPKVIEQRLAAEQHLEELITNGRSAGLEAYCATLMDHLDEHVEQVIKQLEALRTQYT